MHSFYDTYKYTFLRPGCPGECSLKTPGNIPFQSGDWPAVINQKKSVVIVDCPSAKMKRLITSLKLARKTKYENKLVFVATTKLSDIIHSRIQKAGKQVQQSELVNWLAMFDLPPPVVKRFKQANPKEISSFPQLLRAIKDQLKPDDHQQTKDRLALLLGVAAKQQEPIQPQERKEYWEHCQQLFTECPKKKKRNLTEAIKQVCVSLKQHVDNEQRVFNHHIMKQATKNSEFTERMLDMHDTHISKITELANSRTLEMNIIRARYERKLRDKDREIQELRDKKVEKKKIFGPK